MDTIDIIVKVPIFDNPEYWCDNQKVRCNFLIEGEYSEYTCPIFIKNDKDELDYDLAGEEDRERDRAIKHDPCKEEWKKAKKHKKLIVGMSSYEDNEKTLLSPTPQQQ